MVDTALIQKCADPSLKPAIIEKFLDRAGSEDPLSVTVRSGNRVILVPQAKAPAEAMELIRKYVGQAVVRVGITQYPAGLGARGVDALSPDLVDPCQNMLIGTALFGKVYRIVTKWYGNAVEEAFEDAIYAWQTGYFEGKAVFTASDPGKVKLAEPSSEEIRPDDATEDASDRRVTDEADPNSAGIRVDLSSIGGNGPGRQKP